VKWAEEAKDWNPSDARSWTHWIKALEIAGEVSKANTVAWGILERFPENPYVYSELIHLSLVSGRLAEGEQLALEAVEQFPANPYAYSLLAAILERSEKHSQAEAVLRNAGQRFPHNYRWWVDLARALVLQGRLDDAAAELRRTVDRFPNEGYLWNFLGGVLSRLNRLQESEEILRTAATRFQDHVTKVSLAGSIRRQGIHRLREALVVIDEVLSGRPGDIYAMAEKARILGDLGEFEQAASLMEKLRLRDARFVDEEPDVLAQFLVADLDRRQEDQRNSGAEVNRASSLISPLEAAERVTSEEGGIYSNPVPIASQHTGELPKFPVIKLHEADAGGPPFGSESAGEPATSSRDRDHTAAGLRKARHTRSPAATRQDQWELARRVSEARLLRKWALRNELTNEFPTPAELRQKANHLVDGILSQVPNHPTACVEKANLLIESGSLEDAGRFLENRISLMPSAFGLQQALARVNRELALTQKLKFDNEQYAVLTKPLLYLQERNAAFKPLAYLARGRICFAMHDGQELRRTAARNFEHVREYIAERPQVDGEFNVWWSERIQNLLFSELGSRTPLTAENVETLKRCSQENSRRLDVIEEQFTLRMSR
jgi:tetratricopeptide (TPR) repeat protein